MYFCAFRKPTYGFKQFIVFFIGNLFNACDELVCFVRDVLHKTVILRIRQTLDMQESPEKLVEIWCNILEQGSFL